MELQATGNFGKSLRELLGQREKEQREINTIFERFTREHELPLGPILQPIDPESDYGKLVISSRVHLPKGSKVQPVLKIMMAQAQYRQIELAELIAIRRIELEEKSRQHIPYKQNQLATTSTGPEGQCAGSQLLCRTAIRGSVNQSTPRSMSPTVSAQPTVRYFQPKQKVPAGSSAKVGAPVEGVSPITARPTAHRPLRAGNKVPLSRHQTADCAEPAQRLSEDTQEQPCPAPPPQQQSRRRGGRGRRGRAHVDPWAVGTGMEAQGSSMADNN